MAFDLVVFNKQTYTAMTEYTAQAVDKFNDASDGTLVLTAGQNRGDVSEETIFASIAGLVRRRNAYGGGAVTPTGLKQLLEVSVKVAAGTPPIQYEAQQYQWILANPELAALTIGEQLAQGQIQDMLNTAVRSLSAGMAGNADVIHNASTEAPSFQALTAGASKFGDRATSIKAWIVHSTTIHGIYAAALSNTERLFEYGTVMVQRDPFGRRFVVTDSEPLRVAGTPPTYRSLGLVEGACIVQPNGDFRAVLVDKTGGENITSEYQAEWTFNVGMKGYSWNKSGGGASPNDTALGTPTNWQKYATDNKDTAGVMVITK